MKEHWIYRVRKVERLVGELAFKRKTNGERVGSRRVNHREVLKLD